MTRLVARLAAFLVAAASLIGPQAWADSKILRISSIPDEAPTELQRKFGPLAQHLEAATGMKVQYTPVTDYAPSSRPWRRRRSTSPGSAASPSCRPGCARRCDPIVQRAEDEKFTSTYIAGADSGIKGIADLKGKTFAFGSPSSTSGHLMPRYFLGKEGIEPDRDFTRVAFSGAHDATAAFVESGRVDAGVLNTSVWNRLVEQKKVDAGKVKVIGTTPPYFDYNWTVRGDLDPALVKRLTEAFLALDPARPTDKELLDLQRASKFIPTRPENYQGIEEAARSAGLLK